MKVILLVFTAILLFPNLVNSLVISEIMYNPAGNDNNREYVEIFSDEPVNLSDYIIQDTESSDSLKLLQEYDGDYYLIAEEGFNYSSINASVYTVGATIGNNLNNNGDLVMIKDKKGNIIDLIVYSNSMGGDDNNMSLCVLKSNFENNITECIPTPGYQNIFQNLTNSSYDPQINNSNSTNISNIEEKDYSGILINEIMANPVGYDNGLKPDGEWVEIYNSNDYPIDIAGLDILDKSSNKIKITSINTDYTSISQKDYIVVYMNGNSILNNNGFEEIFLKYNNLTIDYVSYQESKQGMSWSRIEGSWILTTPTIGKKNMINTTMQMESPSKNTLIKEESFLKIEKIYPDKIKPGDKTKAKINIYKGKTSKSSIRLYIKGMKDIISFQALDKFTNYSFIVPLKIEADCSSKGNLTLILEGLGKSDSARISVDNAKCTKYSSQDLLADINNSESFLKEVKKNTYEKGKSSSKDSGRFALYLFILGIITGIIYLMKNAKGIKDKVIN